MLDRRLRVQTNKSTRPSLASGAPPKALAAAVGRAGRARCLNEATLRLGDKGIHLRLVLFWSCERYPRLFAFVSFRAKPKGRPETAGLGRARKKMSHLLGFRTQQGYPNSQLDMVFPETELVEEAPLGAPVFAGTYEHISLLTGHKKAMP